MKELEARELIDEYNLGLIGRFELMKEAAESMQVDGDLIPYARGLIFAYQLVISTLKDPEIVTFEFQEANSCL